MLPRRVRSVLCCSNRMVVRRCFGVLASTLAFLLLGSPSALANVASLSVSASANPIPGAPYGGLMVAPY